MQGDVGVWQGRVRGWAWKPGSTEKLELAIEVNGRPQATVIANEARVSRRKIGDSNHGFSWKLPPDIAPESVKQIVIRHKASGAIICQYPPVKVKAPPPVVVARPKPPQARRAAEPEEKKPEPPRKAALSAVPVRLRNVRPQAENWVVNGQITTWTGPLTQSINQQVVTLTEGWSVVSKPVASAVVASLHAVRTRDPILAEEGIDTFAVRLKGPPPPRYLRLEVQLGKPAKVNDGQHELSFWAEWRGSKKNERHFINRIFVIQRKLDRLGGFTDTEIGEVRKKLEIGSFGRYHTLQFSDEASAALTERILNSVQDRSSKFLLVFEIGGQDVDLVLSDVSLAGARQSAPEAAVSSTVALEDQRIVGQLPYLRGLEGWDSPVPLRISDRGIL